MSDVTCTQPVMSLKGAMEETTHWPLFYKGKQIRKTVKLPPTNPYPRTWDYTIYFYDSPSPMYVLSQQTEVSLCGTRHNPKQLHAKDAKQGCKCICLEAAAKVEG